MKTREITINGRTFPVAFALKTMIGFERITGESFFGQKFLFIDQKAALVFAAIIAADKSAQITYDELLDSDDMQTLNDIGKAFETLDEMASEFFHRSEVEPKAEQQEGTDGKN